MAHAYPIASQPDGVPHQQRGAFFVPSSALLRHVRSPRTVQVVADTFAILLSFGVYYLTRYASGWFTVLNEPFQSSSPETTVAALTAVVLAMYMYWMIVFWFSGLYANWYVRSPFDEIFTVIRICFVGCCLLGVAILLDDENFSSHNTRLLVFLYWAELSCAVSCGRVAARWVQRRLRERGIIKIPVMLVGSAAKLNDLVSSVVHVKALGYVPMGAVLNTPNEIEQWKILQPLHPGLQNIPALGTFAHLPVLLEAMHPEEVLVSVEAASHEETLRIGTECDQRGIAMKILPDLYEIFSGQARTTQIYGTPLIEVSQQLMKPWEEILKRLLDIVLSLCALLIGLPFWIAVAVIIRLESPGSALYTQERVGKHGRRFMMYKFRSMRNDAEKSGAQWATKNDPRVTRVGRFIRKTHIDEVPQFWNILKGEMSIVGPRPERPMFVEKYSREIPYYLRRLKVRPGLTGWYQVNFTDQEETVEYVKKRLEYDFFYIENMSFTLDVEIIARTVIRVLKGSGTA